MQSGSNTQRRFLTTGQVGEHCGVNFRTVTRWIKRGYLKAQRLPGRGDHRIAYEDFIEFLKTYQLRNLEVQSLVSKPSPQTPSEARPKALHEDSQENLKKTALIVDDELPVAHSIERILRSLGFETQIAENGFRAGFLISQERPTLITLDLKMKDLDGFGVLSLLGENSILQKTKVLVISGDTAQNLKRALEMGAHGILSKPFSHSNLKSAVLSITKQNLEIAEVK